VDARIDVAEDPSTLWKIRWSLIQ